jgi:ketosteroid isomerase-like protein
MDDRTMRAALRRHWDASDANDFNVEHEIYHEDAVLDYPQSGERIRGRRNIRRAGPSSRTRSVLRSGA